MIVSVFCQRAKMNQKWMNNTKTSLSSYLKVVSVHPSLILLPSLILGFEMNECVFIYNKWIRICYVDRYKDKIDIKKMCEVDGY